MLPDCKLINLQFGAQACDEEKLLGHLGVVLYEYLGEEYPEVLGSILGALKSIVNVIGMTKMTPPIKDLLPRLTPILKNRHEKVTLLALSFWMQSLRRNTLPSCHAAGFMLLICLTRGFRAQDPSNTPLCQTL